jgi:hypothetical protein
MKDMDLDVDDVEDRLSEIGIEGMDGEEVG